MLYILKRLRCWLSEYVLFNISWSYQVQLVANMVGRSLDYPENFGIYYQLDTASNTWFFTFLNVYVSWIKQDKIMISKFSLPKFRYFSDQNGLKGGPHENEFWQFSNAKMSFWNRARKADGKRWSFVWFSSLLPDLWPLNCQILHPLKNLGLLWQFM